ncbi:DUF6179 domain-containing protein [Enterococcus sp. DIV0756]|uniref:DUF6179 domain-containing protein n=1 Tax=Enterococcus sp. DIV0756 TaxID=2774636 RepID=UPI003F259384
MKNEVLDPDFYPFFMRKLQEHLSGSSVITIDQAERIQQSIEFVLAQGGEGSLPERFEQGKHQLKQRLKKLQQLYETIMANYQSFEIDSLKESLIEIGHFFKTYDLEYGAAENDQAFLDYQLSVAVPKDFVGLEYYERYLQNLAAEVFFLKNIPEHQIYELLDCYQEKLGFDYRQDVNNLFEIVFRQIVGKMLIAKKENDTLLLNRVEAQYAMVQIQNEDLPSKLTQLIELNPYYRHVFEQFKETIRHLQEPERAFEFFLSITAKKRRLELPPTLSVMRFNQLLEAYSVADQQEKICLISQNISAPSDFEEFLKITSNTPEFYKRLFKELEKDFIITLILYVMKKYRCENYQAIIDLKGKNNFLYFLKDYLKSLSINDQSQLFSSLEDYQLVSYDFS